MLACETGCNNLKLAINESLHLSTPDFVSTLSAGVQMEGMQAMYTFCAAVLLSLVLSLVVERLEGRGTPLVPAEVRACCGMPAHGWWCEGRGGNAGRGMDWLRSDPGGGGEGGVIDG
jgi:hypothetical protein